MLYETDLIADQGTRIATAGETRQIVAELSCAEGGLTINTASGNEIVCPRVIFEPNFAKTVVVAANEHLSSWPRMVLVHLARINRFEFVLLGWKSENACEASGVFAPTSLHKMRYAQSNFCDRKLLQTMNLWLRE